MFYLGDKMSFPEEHLGGRMVCFSQVSLLAGWGFAQKGSRWQIELLTNYVGGSLSSSHKGPSWQENCFHMFLVAGEVSSINLYSRQAGCSSSALFVAGIVSRTQCVMKSMCLTSPALTQPSMLPTKTHIAIPASVIYNWTD